MTLFRRAITAFLVLLLPPALAGAADNSDTGPPGGGDGTSLRTAPHTGPALNRVLPADQAFMLGAVADADGELVLIWEIRDGYYLYRKSLAIEESGTDGVLGEPELPAGRQIEDPYFGEVEVYYQRLQLRLPYQRPADGELALRVRYQGCAEAGYCYPVQEKTISLSLPD